MPPPTNQYSAVSPPLAPRDVHPIWHKRILGIADQFILLGQELSRNIMHEHMKIISRSDYPQQMASQPTPPSGMLYPNFERDREAGFILFAMGRRIQEMILSLRPFEWSPYEGAMARLLAEGWPETSLEELNHTVPMLQAFLDHENHHTTGGRIVDVCLRFSEYLRLTFLTRRLMHILKFCEQANYRLTEEMWHRFVQIYGL